MRIELLEIVALYIRLLLVDMEVSLKNLNEKSQ